jgi:hypothetical protein
VKRKDVILGKGRLGRRMEEALWRWIHFVDRYCQRRWNDDQDAPYWHNERGSLGLLAAAIWSTGNIALEEHPAEKAVQKGRRRKTPPDGRIDLWYSLGRKDYALEAKQMYVRLSRRNPPSAIKRSVQSVLNSALGNIKAKPGYGNRVGLVFVAPFFWKRRHENPEQMAVLLKRFVEGIMQVDACFIAWCFQPKKRCPFYGPWPRGADSITTLWPGVVVLGRALRRQ